MKKIALSLGLAVSFSLNAHAEDLLQVYRLAMNNDATYQKALATYNAAKEGIPIARAALLPSFQATGNFSRPINKKPTPPKPYKFITQAYTFTLSQSIFDYGDWKTYTQAGVTVKQAAITLEKAKQTLINTIAGLYFAVLQARDNVKYNIANETALKNTKTQVEQKYKVGLKANTDVETARSKYEGARAATILAKNGVDNALENLRQSTNQYLTNLAPLKKNISWEKPKPSNPDVWAKAADTQNLDVIIAKFLVNIDKLSISITQAGYLPTVTAAGTYTRTLTPKKYTTTPDSSTTSAAATITWTPFSGGSTYYTVKKNRFTYQGDTAALVSAKRSAKSTARQAYLGVLSDISQINANHQAIIAAQSALASSQAQYSVGLTTIVDLLTQQATLLQNQQSYATARYKYFTDGLLLQQAAGSLSVKDLEKINKWLVKT